LRADQQGNAGPVHFGDSGWIPVVIVAERIGRTKSVLLRRAKSDGVGERRPLETAGGTLDAVFVPRAWASMIAERYRAGALNALEAAR
jgi:hypothetical protein